MKPIIAIIAARVQDGQDLIDRVATSYSDEILKFNGLPLIVPNYPETIEHFLKFADGVMLLGGIDIHPESYGEEITSSKGMMKDKDEMDRLAIEICLESHMPLLAICRGMQMVNVVRGGTLMQDISTHIPDALEHYYPDEQPETIHEIKVSESRYFPEDTHSVNSIHHQAIHKLAPGLKVTGKSPDGIIEMIEMPEREHFFLGVQWHPECVPGEQLSHSIFEKFLHSAAERKKKLGT